MRRPELQAACFAIALFAPIHSLARADQFVLRSGGTLRGTLERPATPNSAHVVVRLEHGGRVVLERTDVREWRRTHPAQSEYEKRVAAAAQTAAGQWELAEWCRAVGLDQEREAHLMLVLQHDPDHTEARHALGYAQVRGQWQRPGEPQRNAGLVRHRGRWRTPQEMQLMAEREVREKAAKHWQQQLRRWRETLVSGRADQVQECRARLMAIDDPHAIDPLTQMVLAERLRPLKLLFLRALARIPHDRAIHQLMYVTLTDNDVEVFHESVHQVVTRRLPDTVELYIKTLNNVDNQRVNRAALVLRELADAEAVGPLIEALITQHTVVVRPGRGGGTTATFVRPQNAAAARALDAASDSLQGAGSGFTTNDQEQTTRVSVPNQDVLAALVDLSGVNFGFDQAAWRRWHAAQRQQLPSYTTRRDQP